MDRKFLDRKTYGKNFGGSVGVPVLPVFPKSGGVIGAFQLPGTTSITPVYFGSKRYELTDWLGNVRVVINDKKTPVNTGSVTVSYVAQPASVSDYYAFGSQINERTYDPVKPLYRFGFNTQEKVFEITQDHYTAKFWEYDARLGRRWNVDPKPTVGVSEYAVNGDNPIKLNDPEGDCADCKVDARLSINLTYGTRGQSRINFAAGLGVSKTSGNFMSGANLSLNLYNGGPGTTQASTGKNSWGAALTLGLSGTFGSGKGRATDLNIFNSSTLSGITNTFEKSFTIGTNFTYNTATGFNRAAGFAGKFGGFTATFNEDFSFLTGYKPWNLKPGYGILASGFDEGETGGGFLGYTFKSGASIFAGTEIFTGKPTQYPKLSSSDYPGYVEQTPQQQLFNVGRSFLKIENAPGIGNLRFDYSGSSQMWSQNIIHDLMGIDRFRSTAVNSFQITR